MVGEGLTGEEFDLRPDVKKEQPHEELISEPLEQRKQYAKGLSWKRVHSVQDCESFPSCSTIDRGRGDGKEFGNTDRLRETSKSW